MRMGWRGVGLNSAGNREGAVMNSVLKNDFASDESSLSTRRL